MLSEHLDDHLDSTMGTKLVGGNEETASPRCESLESYKIKRMKRKIKQIAK